MKNVSGVRLKKINQSDFFDTERLAEMRAFFVPFSRCWGVALTLLNWVYRRGGIHNAHPVLSCPAIGFVSDFEKRVSVHSAGTEKPERESGTRCVFGVPPSRCRHQKLSIRAAPRHPANASQAAK
ncbi:TPA: hypothetical protein G8P07_004373 [Salmonella enterica]|uniref:Uncharacterized protein n=1 Tax=Salmonella enterica TaxID=28901 RepID=A0A755SF19_SALER|nr:hypothetical protein [Salmonella enterica]